MLNYCIKDDSGITKPPACSMVSFPATCMCNDDFVYTNLCRNE